MTSLKMTELEMATLKMTELEMATLKMTYWKWLNRELLKQK
jgi:hypothetical protein